MANNIIVQVATDVREQLRNMGYKVSDGEELDNAVDLDVSTGAEHLRITVMEDE